MLNLYTVGVVFAFCSLCSDGTQEQCNVDLHNLDDCQMYREDFVNKSPCSEVEKLAKEKILKFHEYTTGHGPDSVLGGTIKNIIMNSLSKAASWIENEYLRFKEALGLSNSLEDLDARLDATLEIFRTLPLIRQEAQSEDEVANHKCDYSQGFQQAKRWEHKLFIDNDEKSRVLGTKGFDPTLRHNLTQLPHLANEHVGQLFSCDNEALENIIVAAFAGDTHTISASEQGEWNNHPKLLNLNERFTWKTETYFDATTNDKRNNWSQQMNNRYIHNAWPNHQEVNGDDYEGPHADVLFAQFYLAGPGQSFVRGLVSSDKGYSSGARFVAELDYAKNLEVKEGQQKYGGDIYFDQDGNVMYIIYDEVTYKPDMGSTWDDIKLRCRGTVVTVMTAIDHLLGVHLHFSNSLAHAVVQLPPDHFLRGLLWPHIFNAIGVNRKAAATLTLEGGLYARGWALTGKGITDAYKWSIHHNPLFTKWMNPKELREHRKIPDDTKMPLYEDGIPFFEITKKYVSDYIKLHTADYQAAVKDRSLTKFWKHLRDWSVRSTMPRFTSPEILADVLATYIYYVTGYHTHSGTLHHEAMLDGVAPSAWHNLERDAGTPPVSAMWAAITYIGTSALTLPITGDACSTQWQCGFKGKMRYFGDRLPADAENQREVEAVGYPKFFDTDADRALNKRWVEDLLELQKEIMKRNVARFECAGSYCRPYNSFDVNFVEMSVGI